MYVFIKGIEMPKHDDQYVIFTVYGDGGVVYGPLNRPHVRYKNRAVPVPEPHDRLIDADAVIDLVMQYCPDDDGVCSKAGADLRELLDEIENLPTIIPASEESET